MVFEPEFDDLPASIPVFPLPGVLLLPRGHLPLNIFEPRYLAMIQDAITTPSRLIGMIQPINGTDGPAPELFSIGCAGRISAFNETDDGRMLISLVGICRFRILEERPVTHGYRRIRADWRPFRRDFNVLDGSTEGDVDRERLTAALMDYFRMHEISADWDAINAAGLERLVTSLAMICPFAPSEKQALLEAPDLAARAELMTSLMEMAVLESLRGETIRH